MKYYLNGFYENQVEGGIEITDDYWQELLNKQSQGGMIQAVDGKVYCIFQSEKVENGRIDLEIVKSAQISERLKVAQSCQESLNLTRWLNFVQNDLRAESGLYGQKG